MSASYDPGDLTGTGSSALKNRVRLEIGDIDCTPKSLNRRLEDEEILFRLDEHGGDVLAAAEACVGDLLARLARTEVSTVSTGLDARYTWLERRCAEIKRRNSMRALPYAAGISVADKEAAEQDADRVPTAFTKGMLDAEGAPQFGKGQTTDESSEGS